MILEAGNDLHCSTSPTFRSSTLAINFAKIISDVEEKQTAVTTLLVNNKELLHSARESFGQNMNGMLKEVAKIETRITEVAAQIK